MQHKIYSYIFNIYIVSAFILVDRRLSSRNSNSTTINQHLLSGGWYCSSDADFCLLHIKDRCHIAFNIATREQIHCGNSRGTKRPSYGPATTDPLIGGCLIWKSLTFKNQCGSAFTGSRDFCSFGELKIRIKRADLKVY